MRLEAMQQSGSDSVKFHVTRFEQLQSKITERDFCNKIGMAVQPAGIVMNSNAHAVEAMQQSGSDSVKFHVT
jgi:hypothetical protein